MFKPSLVTRSVQRAYGIEHPIGDPFGGPAYGQKEKDGIEQILGSAASIIGGAAMMMTPAAPLGAMLIGGAMVAGGAMSAIGSISGNQTLMKIGNITSAVAGVAGLGYTAYNNWDSISNFFSSGTELTQTSNAVGNAAGSTGSMSDIPGLGWNASGVEGATIPGVGEVSGGFAGTGTSGAIINAPTQAAFNPATIQGGADGAAYTFTASAPNNAAGGTLQTSIVNAGDGGYGSAANVDNILSGKFGSGGATISPYGTSVSDSVDINWGGDILGGAQANVSPGIGASAKQVVNGSSAFGATTNNAGGDIGLLQKVGGFIEKNPLASMIGLQAVSGLAEGASPKSQAEGEYLQAQADYLKAKADYEQASQEVNINQTIANTEYLQSKAQEFEKTKAYADEKRRLYNESIQGIQMPNNMIDYSSALFNRNGSQTNAGIINGARA